jgi:hypothetical protein
MNINTDYLTWVASLFLVNKICALNVLVYQLLSLITYMYSLKSCFECFLQAWNLELKYHTFLTRIGVTKREDSISKEAHTRKWISGLSKPTGMCKYYVCTCRYGFPSENNQTSYKLQCNTFTECHPYIFATTHTTIHTRSLSSVLFCVTCKTSLKKTVVQINARG